MISAILGREVGERVEGGGEVIYVLGRSIKCNVM